MNFLRLNLIGWILISIFVFPSSAMADTGDVIGVAFIGLILTVAIFLIFREILCWYWKINQRTTLEENILKELRIISGLLNNTPKIDREIKIEPLSDIEKPSDDDLSRLKKLSGDDAVTYASVTESSWTCVCGTQNSLNMNRCSNCGRFKDYILKNYQRENFSSDRMK